ncbi:MAG: MFS transporter [Acidimicrobiia bacterium]|nr:MFS transporter [Acidimicrobiia bacterium]
MPSQRLPSVYRLPRIILLSYIATMMLGIGVVFSLLAVIQDRFGFPTWSLGLLAGLPLAMSLFGNLFLAPFADRGWEIRLIGLGCGLVVVALLWMVFADQLWQWIAARMLLGLAEGSAVAAARRVMLSWQPDQSGRALGAILMVMYGGILLGPPLGGFLYEIEPTLPFITPAVFGMVALMFLPKVKPGEGQVVTTRLSRRGLTALPGFLSGLIMAASNWIYIGVFDTIWSRYLTDLGVRPLMIGVGFVVIALPSMLLIPVGGRLADRINPIGLALVASLMGLPFLAGYGLVSTFLPLLVVGAFHSGIWAFVTLPGQAAVARSAPASQASEAQGMIEATGLTMAALSAFAAAPLYDAYGPRTLFLLTAAATAVLVLAVILRRPIWKNAF